MNLKNMLLWRKTNDFMDFTSLLYMSEESLVETLGGDDGPHLIMPLTAVSAAILDFAEQLNLNVLSPNPEVRSWNKGNSHESGFGNEMIDQFGKGQAIGYITTFTLVGEGDNQQVHHRVEEGFETIFRSSDEKVSNPVEIRLSLCVDLDNSELSGTYELSTDVLLVRDFQYNTPDYNIYAAAAQDELPSADSVAGAYIPLMNYLYVSDRDYPCSMEEHSVVDTIYAYREIEEALNSSIEAGKCGPETIREIAHRFGISHQDFREYMVTFEEAFA